MTTLRPVATGDLRVIMCMAFNQQAPTAEVAAFKSALRDWEHVVSCCDLTGSFNFMLEAAIPSMEVYGERLEDIKEQHHALINRYEAYFVCKKFVRVPKTDAERAVWVPCHDGLRRIDCSCIDKVTAEGDYMRVHCGHDSWLVHVTMREMLRKLGKVEFLHLHRSCLVRSTSIERLIHQGRHWTARLDDGSLQPVAKAHVADVLGTLGIESSKSGHESLKTRRFSRPEVESRRKRLERVAPS